LGSRCRSTVLSVTSPKVHKTTLRIFRGRMQARIYKNARYNATPPLERGVNAGSIPRRLQTLSGYGWIFSTT
jgi:hypothetical protein